MGELVERIAPRPTLLYTLAEQDDDDGPAAVNEVIRAVPESYPNVLVIEFADAGDDGLVASRAASIEDVRRLTFGCELRCDGDGARSSSAMLLGAVDGFVAQCVGHFFSGSIRAVWAPGSSAAGRACRYE